MVQVNRFGQILPYPGGRMKTLANHALEGDYQVGSKNLGTNKRGRNLKQ